MKFFPLILILITVLTVNNSCGQSQAQKKYPYTNALIHESSPYLLQHAHNPVDWYPWGEEALNKAKKENKPLLISIGYAACHWCHVMERESYSDTPIARFMNEHFVCIKVDREERPDIDQIYMDAAMLINGNAGWPLNAFALPDGKPFYATTYQRPKEWLELLTGIDKVYREQQDKVLEQANSLMEGIANEDLVNPPTDPTLNKINQIYQDLFKNNESAIDFEKGGFQQRMKFPLPSAWEWMLQDYYLTGNKDALKATEITLDNMAAGGIYDQLGGGFCRYSTDPDWKVPHFEKMLYDNAQLISLYSHAWKINHQPEYKRIVEETIQFVFRELKDSKGGYYSSLNADSEGEEGKFYVWSKDEIEKALSANEAALFMDYYHITGRGNWENGKNILYKDVDPTSFLKKHHLTTTQWQTQLAQSQQKLFKLRSKRVRPSTDTKVLTSWNALMLKALLDAYTAFGDQKYLEAALENAHFLEQNMIHNKHQLYRNYMNGKAGIDGMLDDYALLSSAWIKLYEVTFDIHWLNQAKGLTEYVQTNFKDKNSPLFYYTDKQSHSLIARKKEIDDNVIPSSNSVLAKVLLQLGTFYDLDSYNEEAKDMAIQIKDNVSEHLIYFGNWAQLLGVLKDGYYEVAIMGADAENRNKELQKNYLPISIFLGGDKENLPLLESKLRKGSTTIYVCKDKVCKQPVQEPGPALEQMKDKGK